jgi:hypothetical protein
MSIDLIKVPPLIAHLFLHPWHIHLHDGDIVLLHNGRHRGLIPHSFDEIPFEKVLEALPLFVLLLLLTLVEFRDY